MGICVSQSRALALDPGPGPNSIHGTRSQFVFDCTGPQFVFEGRGPSFAFTVPDH